MKTFFPQPLTLETMKRKLLFWSARILAILAILFFLVFSLDCFEGGTLRDQLTCFFMHNIPAFILIAILVIAWRWEMAGGILFIAAAIAGAIFFGAFSGNTGVIWLLMPLVLVGILFILQDGRLRKKAE